MINDAQVELATKEETPSQKVIEELKTEVDNLKRLVTKQVAAAAAAAVMSVCLSVRLSSHCLSLHVFSVSVPRIWNGLREDVVSGAVLNTSLPAVIPYFVSYSYSVEGDVQLC